MTVGRRLKTDRGRRAFSPVIRTLTWVLLIAATVITFQSLWIRHIAEGELKQVAMVVDSRELESLVPNALSGAAAGSTDTEKSDEGLQFLKELRAAGVLGVGLHEYTLQDAADDGRIFILTKAALETTGSPYAALLPDHISSLDRIVGRVLSHSAEVEAGAEEEDSQSTTSWLDQALIAALEERAKAVYVDSSLRLWRLDDDAPSPAEIALGFDPQNLAAIEEADLWVVPRMRTSPGQADVLASPAHRGLVEVSPGPVVFWGAQVPGHPQSLPVLGQWLRDSDLPIGLIEFAPQEGLLELARETDFRAVRVHSITDREMAAGMPRDRAWERWLRAVRERNVRLLYVRLYLPDAPIFREDAGSEGVTQAVAGVELQTGKSAPHETRPGPREYNLQYIKGLANRLQDDGYLLDRPQPLDMPATSLWTLLPLALLVGGVGGALVRNAVPFVWRIPAELWVIAGAVLLSGGFVFLWLKGYTILARQGLALSLAVVWPVLAVDLTWRQFVDRNGQVESDAKGQGQSWGNVIATFGLAASVALFGALLLIPIMGDVRFLLRLEEFRGVKLAHILPLAWVWLLMHPAMKEVPGHGGIPQDYPGIKGLWYRWERALRAMLKRQVPVGYVMLGALAGLALVVYLLRTGNQGLTVWGLEDTMRRFLEETFAARPRTKEFLIGHPAMMVGLAALSFGVLTPRSLLARGFVTVGCIGLISIVNTFAHAHTPIVISLFRTGYGLALGVLSGFVAWQVTPLIVHSFKDRDGREASG